MMSLAMALAATGMQLAEPKGYPGSWLTDADYPMRESQKYGQGSTRITLVIDPDGKARRCDVAITSGSATLDKKACEVLMERARFAPATDQDGNAVFGTFSSSVNWRTPGSGENFRMNQTDLILVVKSLPNTVKMPSRVRVMALVGADGKLERCEPVPVGPNAAILGPAACQQVAAMLKLNPVHDGEIPVRSVQDLTIGFNVQKTK